MHENRLEEIEHELSVISHKDEDINEQIELSLELMQTLQYQWASLDLSKKAEALGILTQKITLGKNGKDKPLIIWELPWNALFKIGKGSKLDGWQP